MPPKSVQTIPLPSFLPIPGDQLQKLFPANHDSIVAVLGLTKAFRMHMHPTKPSCSNESADVIAHLLSLFINDPTIQAFLPKGTMTPSNPSKELTALQMRLVTMDSTLSQLAKATTEANKGLKKIAQPHPPAKPTQEKATKPTPTAPSPSYTAKAATPQHPSTVVNVAMYTWADNTRPSPADICTTINQSLDHSNTTQVRVSTSKWTPKGNLVLWSGPNTSVSCLNTTLPTIAEALHASLSVTSSAPPKHCQ
ncbi:hypothetical protein BJV74DRAFT_890374 [Russula compacta]|nr:hypothetical protein BJV74DRAFT_890374 [Russula compacta]